MMMLPVRSERPVCSALSNPAQRPCLLFPVTAVLYPGKPVLKSLGRDRDDIALCGWVWRRVEI